MITQSRTIHNKHSKVNIKINPHIKIQTLRCDFAWKKPGVPDPPLLPGQLHGWVKG